MRFLFLLLTFAAFMPASTEAQRFVRVREPAKGELAPGDSTRADGAPYDTWHFRAEPGHAYAIHLVTAFDAQLAVGPGVGPACEADVCARAEAGGNGRFDASLFFMPERQGLYPIRVGAVRAGETGGYELVMEEMELPGADADTIPADPPTPAELADAAAARAARPRNLFWEAPESGTLRVGRRNAHGEHYEEWSYYVPAGETVTVRVESDEFDTVLRLVGGGMEWNEELAWDDDGGEGTNSTLTFTHPRSGVYRVQVAGKGDGASGRYTIVAFGHGNVQTDAVAPPPAGTVQGGTLASGADSNPSLATPVRVVSAADPRSRSLAGTRPPGGW